MREKGREIRRRRRRREKARKVKIRALIAQAGANPKKKPAEAVSGLKEEKKIIKRKAATKIIKPAQEAKGPAETVKKGEE